ncbi:MAG: hypothetical protein KDB73_09695 [Planctomycetes bacterium]|nr:hypothetical protein [Planctomycetota bacterium]
MGGFYVGIALRLSLEDVKRVLREMFPATTVHESAEFRATFRGQYSGIVFDMYTNESEFPVYLDFATFPGPQDEDVLQPVAIELARRISVALGCRTICEGSLYGDNPHLPCYGVMWDVNRAWLVDEGDFATYDEGGGPVELIRPLEIPPLMLGPSGDIVSGESPDVG